jgi:guanidinopropionase
MEECRAIGLQTMIEAAVARAGDGPVSITFDLDSLDPSIAPAVSNIEIGEGGFTIDEANLMLRALRGLDIVGADVVCLMPTKDLPNQQTAMVAGHIAAEQVSLIADRLVSGGR